MASDIFEKWAFIGDALNGTGGFYDGGYISKYEYESDTKFNARKKDAFYVNIFRSKIDRYLGNIYRASVKREAEDERFELFWEDVDRTGTKADTFFMNVARNAKARGVGIVVVDNVANDKNRTVKDSIENRLFPFAYEVLPENVVEYKLDEYGRFEYIAFKAVEDASTFGKIEQKNIIKYFDKTSWKVFKESDKTVPIKSGDHGLGVCPVVFSAETGRFDSIGEFSQVAWILKRHYNLLSEQDENLRFATFSPLAIQADAATMSEQDKRKIDSESVGTADSAMIMGNGGLILYPPGTAEPKFLKTDPTPARTFSSKIQALEDLIDKITYDIVSSNNRIESGESLRLKFRALNSSLSIFATTMEMLEARVADIVKRYMGVADTPQIVYKKDYNITSVSNDLEDLGTFTEKVGYSETLVKSKAVDIAQNILNTNDKDVINKIREEIEQSIAERKDAYVKAGRTA